MRQRQRQQGINEIAAILVGHGDPKRQTLRPVLGIVENAGQMRVAAPPSRMLGPLRPAQDVFLSIQQLKAGSTASSAAATTSGRRGRFHVFIVITVPTAVALVDRRFQLGEKNPITRGHEDIIVESFEVAGFGFAVTNHAGDGEGATVSAHRALRRAATRGDRTIVLERSGVYRTGRQYRQTDRCCEIELSYHIASLSGMLLPSQASCVIVEEFNQFRPLETMTGIKEAMQLAHGRVVKFPKLNDSSQASFALFIFLYRR